VFIVSLEVIADTGASIFISLFDLGFILSTVLTFSIKFLPMQVSFQLHICIKNNGSLNWSHEISRQRQMTGRVPVI